MNIDERGVYSDGYELLDLIEKQRFGVEYQPMIDTLSGNIIGYEALARFYAKNGVAIPPQKVFEALHSSPLMLAQTELQLKRLQLRYRPEEVTLFLNLDPHAYSVFSQIDRGNALVDMLSGHTQLVVEIIENTDVNDARISNELSSAMHREGFSIALDDVGAPGSMVSLNILSDVDYIKFDRSWLKTSPETSMYKLLKGLINYASTSGKRTVLEGIETPEDLATAVNLGIDYVQGFFFRELFIAKNCYA